MTDIAAILRSVPLKEGESLGDDRIVSISHHDQQLRVMLNVTGLSQQERQTLQHAIERALKDNHITHKLHLIMTSERQAATDSGASNSMRPPNVGHIVAVASGKGGVGKSTLAVSLAVALTQLNHTVAIMDADIHGPSLPTMLGVADAMPPQNEQGFIPPTPHGIAMMSVGLLLEKDTPLIWRSPMIISAMTTLLTKVAWQQRDFLIVDLPPGTGDASLTLAQKAQPDGVVIVSTPQEVALLDARKAILAFKRLSIPILGIVENMSFFECPHCGERTAIFSADGAQKEAQKQNIPLLGQLPINSLICDGGENGIPLNINDPHSTHAHNMKDIAHKLIKNLKT